MAEAAREYELVLMLDPEVSEEGRDKIADDVRQRIDSGGELSHADNWGMRKLAYEIRLRNEADYRFFRFHGDNALLDALDHNLKIVDGALRFRIFKVDAQTPTQAPPSGSQPAGVGADRGPGRDEGAGPPRSDAPPPAPPAETPAPPAAAPPPAEAPPAEAPAPPAEPA